MLQHLRARELTFVLGMPFSVHTVQIEHVLCYVEADGVDVCYDVRCHGWYSNLFITMGTCEGYHDDAASLRGSIRGILTSMPQRRTNHDISFTTEYAPFAAELKNKHAVFFVRGLKLCKTLHLLLGELVGADAQLFEHWT